VKARGRYSIGPLMGVLVAGALLGSAVPHPAAAQGLVPADFFNAPLSPDGTAGVEADELVFDAATGVIRAAGDVVLTYQGYVVEGESLVFNRRSNEVRMTGTVRVTDPSGNVLETTDLEITGGMKQAFLNALTITSYDGSRITADSADYDEAVETILVNASYAPCGECIDAKGRRIGWSVSAARIVQNSEDGSLYLEQPTLALLGVPVAWLPFLWLPGTEESVLSSVRTPSIDSSEAIGLKVEVPIMAHSSRWTDIILTPTLLTRQGFLMGAEWVQRFDRGSFQIKASGLYQFDRAAFAGTVGDRDWRGAIQTSGVFTPVADWTAGWSYTAFSDAAYLTDYRMTVGKSTVNEVYATHLSEDTYFDIRAQQFNLLGNVTQAEQGQQGRALPVTRFSHVMDLTPGLGRLSFEGRLLNVHREFDDTATANGVPYVLGHAGQKTHASFQAGWQTQWVGLGGVVATPYVGARADLAYYDGTSPLLPGATSLFSATPIAALDLRYPLMASNGRDVHIIEPIAQIVYRGSGTTMVGITNDDAQSFVFDDTNLFSYNRFSGQDRQETGLRANIGGRYQANLADGGYFEVIAGQSFHLAGPNAFAAADPALTGVGSGLANTASYAVLGAYGSVTPGVRFGGKMQVDTGSWQVARAGAEIDASMDGYGLAFDYHYIAANAALGTLSDQHEIGAELTVPVADYWRLKAGTAWDIAGNSWLQVSGGVEYDDGYLVFGANATRTGPTHTSPSDTRLTATFRIKTPAGLNLGYSGAVPAPSF